MTELTVRGIASVCQETLKAYTRAVGLHHESAWSLVIPEDRVFADRLIGTLLDHPAWMPYQIHNEWCDRMEASGWKYGPEKNTEKRTHPLLVEWSELTKQQQCYWFLYRSTVLSLSDVM